MVLDDLWLAGDRQPGAFGNGVCDRGGGTTLPAGTDEPGLYDQTFSRSGQITPDLRDDLGVPGLFTTADHLGGQSAGRYPILPAAHADELALGRNLAHRFSICFTVSPAAVTRAETARAAIDRGRCAGHGFTLH